MKDTDPWSTKRGLGFSIPKYSGKCALSRKRHLKLSMYVINTDYLCLIFPQYNGC